MERARLSEPRRRWRRLMVCALGRQIKARSRRRRKRRIFRSGEHMVFKCSRLVLPLFSKIYINIRSKALFLSPTRACIAHLLFSLPLPASPCGKRQEKTSALPRSCQPRQDQGYQQSTRCMPPLALSFTSDSVSCSHSPSPTDLFPR